MDHGYVESACVTPFETVKVRMQTKENMARYASSAACAREIVRAEGARGLYAGFWPTCLRNNVFNACYFGSIHWCKGFMSTPETFVEQAGQNIGVGVVAGLVATAFKMPFDILKSRMQGQVPSASGAATAMVLPNVRREITGAGLRRSAWQAGRTRSSATRSIDCIVQSAYLVAAVGCGGVLAVGSLSLSRDGVDQERVIRYSCAVRGRQRCKRLTRDPFGKLCSSLGRA